MAILLLFVSCSPNSPEEYCKEGESEARALIDLFRQVESKEDFLQVAPKIKKRVEKLTQLMIQAKKMHIRYPRHTQMINHTLSESLKQEMTRMYRINGVEEKMHKLQRYSLHKLDEFDRELTRPKIKKRSWI